MVGKLPRIKRTENGDDPVVERLKSVALEIKLKQ